MKTAFTEAEIIAGCARNERAFQEILYRQHFAVMMQMCLRYTNGDKDRAFEILNDGFLRVFKKIHLYEAKGSLQGWIRRLIFHAISDYFKSNNRYLSSVVLEEQDAHDALHTEGGHHNSPPILGQLYFEDLLKMVDRLPPATREVFQLYAIEGFTHPEISEQLNISVGTSKWHLSAAREKLKLMINENSVKRLII